MDPYKQTMGMNKTDYRTMRGQNLYDMSDKYRPAEASFFSNLAVNPNMGYGDPSGPPSLGPGIGNMIPANDQNMNYYQEYCRLFIANVALTTQMKELIAEKNELLGRLSQLEKTADRQSKEYSNLDISVDKKARIRRKAADVERHYECAVETCKKSYGAEGSLLQHIKLKHPEMMQNPEWKAKFLKNDDS